MASTQSEILPCFSAVSKAQHNGRTLSAERVRRQEEGCLVRQVAE